MASPAASEVYIIDASDRNHAVEALWHEVGLPSFDDKTVAVKANFNSDDPSRDAGGGPRAGPECRRPDGPARGAERDGGDPHGAEEPRRRRRRGPGGAEVVALDALPPEGWEAIPSDGLHWQRGFLIARIFRAADAVVQTCCLKTHRFGGHVSLSLKNPVGVVAKRDPADGYNYMAELHSSPHQRRMIAEINRFFPCDIAILDATEGFSTGGPEQGNRIAPNVILASTDRVALDAAGIALLRHYGSTPEVMRGRIFGMDPIVRAAELGIGVKSAQDLRLVALDSESKDLVLDMRRILDQTA
ncbi:MAG: hypothetical protein XE10_0459 [Methanoculleus marisnigri]|jgi:Uncharacterized conserved protein|uniref:DUF362 domain-containing protein n=1 Tax=Methanoculleus marisnigri TaxID=2198 RepID=A0A101GRU4_9EURY|nr:MAG: hypothetical protein XD82_0302 [Methanoculleus marisnigri]KUL03538.1 MAG: hypothetical protein XE10_0459 [Methanoculleus marisnigri]